jgi:hypothetical protein
LLLLTHLALLPAARADDDFEPPVAGQPAHFSGAVGNFRVTARAEPTELQAEDPLTYTLAITATSPARRPPERPHLQDFPAFARQFYIEDIGPPEGNRPDGQTWEFAYRLKPKSVAVQSIPGIPFVWYRPGALPARLGYRTLYTPEIPLKVKPRREVESSALPPAPIEAPGAAFELAVGPAVLRHESVSRLPGPIVLALLLLAAPAGCVAWYLTWRRLYPDAARRARQQRSRAAQEALKALQRAAPPEGDAAARRAAAVVVRYLRYRLELPMHDPTPAEAAAHLRRVGVSDDLAGQTVAFFRACDAARYDPTPAPRADLAALASALILALEAETWA